MHAGLVAHERNGEQRLDARRAARDDRDRSRRRDRVDVAVAQHLHRTNAIAVARRARRSRRDPRWICAHSGNGPRSLASRSLSASTRRPRTPCSLPAELHALVAVVGDAEPHERVGKAHDAEADAADALRQRVDLRQRILVDVDDVVEEVRRTGGCRRLSASQSMLPVVPHSSRR